MCCTLPAGDSRCLCCIGSIRLSVRLTCYQAAEITIQAWYSHANYEFSLQACIKQSICYLSLFCSFQLPVYLFAFLSVSYWKQLTSSSACPAFSILPDSSFYSCLSVPVRWNIGALLMIQQPFLYFIHPSVPYSEATVQSGLASSLVSLQQWSWRRAVLPDRLLSSPVTYTTCTALITRLRQIELVSGVRALTGEVDYWNISDEKLGYPAKIQIQQSLKR